MPHTTAVARSRSPTGSPVSSPRKRLARRAHQHGQARRARAARPRSRAAPGCAAARLPKPMPGSTTQLAARSRAHARVAADSASSAATSPSTSAKCDRRAASSPARRAGARARARASARGATRASAGSWRRPETSFTTRAPAASAASRDRGLARVDRDRRRQLLRERLDHGAGARDLELGGRPRRRRAASTRRPRRARARRPRPARARRRARRPRPRRTSPREQAPAVRERVGRQVQRRRRSSRGRAERSRAVSWEPPRRSS